MRENKTLPENQTMREGEFVVTVEKFFEMTKGRINFDPDQITLMLSHKHDMGEDFLATVNNRHFRVPHAHINEFFKTYKKPDRPLDPKLELELLRKQNAALIEKLGEDPFNKPKFDTGGDEFSDVLEKKEAASDEDPVLPPTPVNRPSVNRSKSKKKKSVPKRVNVAPLKITHEKTPLAELQADLARDIQGKNPDISNR